MSVTTKRALPALAAIAMLTGCATTPEYTSPSSGPVAGIVFHQGEPVGATGFKWANEISFGNQDYDQAQWIRTSAPLRLIGFTRNTEPVELTTLIPADQPGYFVVRIETWAARCTDAFSFVPAANNVYLIQPELADDGSCHTSVIDQRTGASPDRLQFRD